MSLKDELEKVRGVSDIARESYDGIGAQLARLNGPMDVSSLSPAILHVQRPEERAAECFMDGLREHIDNLARGILENQEIQMFCYHGPERLQVLEVSMPSENVVSLRCLNSDSEETYVTGHMHSVTFSYTVHTIVPPEVKRPIGFRMPSES